MRMCVCKIDNAFCSSRYNRPVIWVTENGVSVPDESNESLPGVLNDTFRINFYRDYMQAAMAAISEDQARACSLAPALAYGLS